MSEFTFPTDTCVLACSGPSLNTVDVFSLGLPVVAVSTAIRKIPKPNFWVLADYLNEMHDDVGREAYSNPDIIKIVPNNKVSSGSNPQSMVLCNYDTSTRWPDLDKYLFCGKQPFIRGPHKSVTFGIQWLHYIGVKRIIWAGNDLTASSMKGKYCYEVKDFDMKKEYNYHKTLDQTTDALKKWYPIALSKGFEWYSWNCGTVFESFVPKFDIDWWEKEGKDKTNQTNFLIPKKYDTTHVVVEKKINPPKRTTPPNPKNRKEKEQPVVISEEPPKNNIIDKMDPSKEIVSNVRSHRRQQIEFRKNLRSI